MRRLLPTLVIVLALTPLGGSASAGGPDKAPGQTAPTNTSSPSITGSAAQDQSVTADAGSWTGPNPTYAYEWARCDSAGATCSAIAGATSPSYAFTKADVGSTVRVVVTATNKNGTGVATSGATSAVSSPATTTTTTTTPTTTTTTTTTASTTTASTTTTAPTTTTTATGTTTTTSTAFGYYFNEHFNGTFNNPFWIVEAPSPSSYGWTGSGGRLTDCASGSGACSISSSSYGQLTSVWAMAQYAHGGYSGTTNGREEDTWYRFKVRFPTDYQPTVGGQNTFFSLHVDGATEQNAVSVGKAAYSSALMVQSDGYACPGSPPLCTTTGTNPRLMLRVTGGDLRSTSFSTARYYQMPSNSLLRDHWYDIVLHFYWSAGKGHVGWWVDGQNIVDTDTPTLFLRTNGTLSYAEGIGFYNYRLWATWPAAVEFDELVWGPSLASVGG